MLRPRIIPCLLVHNNGLVKTVNFKSPKYVGDPINAVKIFNEKESDELIVLDIDSTANNIEPNYKMIARLAAECRMPLCYGGGVRTAEQAKKIIALGVEKVAISSAIVDSPQLITQIAEEVGCQSVVVVYDVKKRLLSKDYDIYTHNGRKKAKHTLFEMVSKVQALGAGEIVVNSIDNDGLMKGYDLDLALRIKQIACIPITILGGAGSLKDIGELVRQCGIIGASAGSVFVFKGKYRAVLINYPTPAEKDELLRTYLFV
jgi:imidazole glycerol-phosphate synthase subunit HisF